jgi:hypothetical protein
MQQNETSPVVDGVSFFIVQIRGVLGGVRRKIAPKQVEKYSF